MLEHYNASTQLYSIRSILLQYMALRTLWYDVKLYRGRVRLAGLSLGSICRCTPPHPSDWALDG